MIANVFVLFIVQGRYIGWNWLLCWCSSKV